MSLRPVSSDKILKVLGRCGFEIVRQRGSHVILKHPDGRLTVVPVHKGEDIGRGLLLKIINDVGITREELLKLLKET